MKKYIYFIICFVSTLSFSQSSKNLLELEEEIKSIRQETFQMQNLNHFPDEMPQKKKTGLAIIYSILLPGMGELYANSYSSGKYFTIAEGALWVTFIGMNTYAGWQRDRYKSLAVSKAGISLEGKDEEYFGTISEYLSIEQYNTEKALERSFEEMYTSKSFNWNWETPQDRQKYRSMWVSSEQVFNDVRFVVGAMLLNRLASAINAVRLVAAYNKRIEQELSWNFSIGISNQVNLPGSLTFNFQKSF